MGREAFPVTLQSTMAPPKCTGDSLYLVGRDPFALDVDETHYLSSGYGNYDCCKDKNPREGDAFRLVDTIPCAAGLLTHAYKGR
jgi:hypothetical protein